MDFNDMLMYVKKTLEDNNSVKSKNVHHQFRNRYKHSYRVYLWTMRLAADFPDCDLDVLKCAAIFHDSGYAYGKRDHALYSAEIFRNYAYEHKKDFSDEAINKISYLIRNHSNKTLIKTTSNIELSLLLEADLLDEEGAMGILWDLLAKGHKGVDDYEEALEEINVHSIHILDQDFMITPLAKKYWKRKKELVKNFVDEIKIDLFIDGENGEN